jgi:hypothetical protein
MEIYEPVKEGECWRTRKKQGYKGHITGVRYCKMYKIPPIKIDIVMLKECKTKQCQKNCGRYNGRHKRK